MSDGAKPLAAFRLSFAVGQIFGAGTWADVEHALAEHPHVHLHFVPTYASWLNQVELWFSKIELDLIHRGVFTSTNDLARRIVTTSVDTQGPRAHQVEVQRPGAAHPRCLTFTCYGQLW